MATRASTQARSGGRGSVGVLDRAGHLDHGRGLARPPGRQPGAGRGGTWRVTGQGGRASLAVELFGPLSAQDTEAATEEGARLLALVAADAGTRDVRFTRAD